MRLTVFRGALAVSTVLCLSLVAGHARLGEAQETDSESKQASPWPDAVVLASGERLPCRIVKMTRGRVHAEIGNTEVELETSSLLKVQMAGQPSISPAVVTFARELATNLTSPSPEVVEAAHAGLVVLAKTHAQVLMGLSKHTRSEAVRTSLETIAKEAIDRAKTAAMNPVVDAPKESAETNEAKTDDKK